uniref:B-cell scaffold protein with ankyrin repeats n=1 Tax=Monopterus albus TaxID=43700 RepID=A0A3Q3R463_MONAL|nr:B-cell scaffold protein with ankyrin repeats [Monopterus albus]
MSQTAEELLIIYESEAEQWATYLQSVFSGALSEAGICCYDISTVSSQRDDFLVLAQYTCKLLILSKGMLEGLCQMRRFFLARVLSPSDHVVVLLCGVKSLSPLLELVPLNGDECLQISSDQDAHEYLASVTGIVRKVSATAANANPLTHRPSGSEQKMERLHSNGAQSIRSSTVAVPSRVQCRSSTEVFILLKKEAAGSNTEVEFTSENHTLRVKPVGWNQQTLCVNAPDFPAGNVRVTVYSNGVPLGKAQLQYYSSMEEVACLLSRAADPVDFMCQALRVSSVEQLDQKLYSMFLKRMPTGGFQGLHYENTHETERHHADIPSLLHFAAQFGFRSVSKLLLQCPGAERALHTANRHGQTPAEVAQSHGHTELHVLLKETLKMLSSKDSGEAGVYEMMCTAGSPSTADVQKEQQGEGGGEEDLYTVLGVNDERDTILNSTKAVVIANRPPAPTPRPESSQVKEAKTPYIAQVFQKKKTPQGDDVYSLATKEADGRKDSISSTYDTVGPNQLHTLQQLTEAGSLSVDEALERFSNGQGRQRGRDVLQQEMLSQPPASLINNGGDGDGVYDKISAARHTPSVSGNDSRRGSRAAESDFYSKPLREQHSHFLWKADKQ